MAPTPKLEGAVVFASRRRGHDIGGRGNGAAAAAVAAEPLPLLLPRYDPRQETGRLRQHHGGVGGLRGAGTCGEGRAGGGMHPKTERGWGLAIRAPQDGGVAVGTWLARGGGVGCVVSGDDVRLHGVGRGRFAVCLATGVGAKAYLLAVGRLIREHSVCHLRHWGGGCGSVMGPSILEACL